MNIYIDNCIFFKAVVTTMCDIFQVTKNTFFCLANISVASSVQVTLQLYFQIFYSTAPNKIVIKLTKLKKTNCYAKVSRG